MLAPGSLPALVAMVRFYMRPVRRGADRAVHGAQATGRTWDVHLGPQEVHGHTIRMRSPRLDDAAEWRSVRLRNRAQIEPWWVTSPLTWEERHSEASWVSHLLQTRRAAIAGFALPLVAEFDGSLVGECNLDWIAPHAGTAEMSVWLDSSFGGSSRVSTVAAAMVIDHAVSVLGLHRLTAPICEGNSAAAWGAKRLGLMREGTMAGFLDVGGSRRDHDLWAITADRLPPGGCTAAMLALADRGAPRAGRVGRLVRPA